MIRIELRKQLRRTGYWVVLGILTAVSVVVTVIIGLTSAATPERLGDYGSVVPKSSGLSMALIALNALLLFLLPLAVAVFAGESVAGESSWGSLRYLLARRISRRRLLASKVAVAGLYALAAVVLVAVAGLVSGIVAFGWHPLPVIDLQHASPFASGVSVFSPLQGLARVGLATAIVAGTMVSTFAFAILCSTLTDRPFSAVAGAVFMVFVSRALDNIPGLHALGPWLPVTDKGTGLWTQLFSQPAYFTGYPHLALVHGVYTV
ncbi:MAG TPA: ABC transporter permease, partial [Acidimicrobiales bacterium]|nr:ABC transporter permease [Acidimicrobiales bacterium]